MEEITEATSINAEIYSRTSGLNNEDVPSIFLENASLLYCLFLQCHFSVNMGYIKTMQNCISTLNDILQSNAGYIVGSVAEGLFVPGQSDLDCMTTVELDICCDQDCIQEIDRSKYRHVYIAHRQLASPGYTFLLDLTDFFENYASPRAHYETFKFEINEYFASRKILTTDIIKSSKDFMKLMKSRSGFKSFGIHGPAYRSNTLEIILPIILERLQTSPPNDTVYAIPFMCDDILRNWFDRKRKQEWPSEVLKRQISGMQGHVVPVGRKESRFEEYEWRICYTHAEIKLVHSLNEVQMMLYFKLKVFSKTVLEEVCPDTITSYVIKNVVFWLAESVPNTYFECKYFIPLFRATLVCLKKFVLLKELPNYMIPERNLFAGKLMDNQKQEALVEVLSYWIEKCPILEVETDILPLYEAVLSRNTDQFSSSQSQQISMVSCVTSKLFGAALSIIAELGEGDDDGILALKTIFEFTDNEISELFKPGNTDTVETLKNALSKTKYFNILSYIANITLGKRQDTGTKDLKVIIEPELD